MKQKKITAFSVIVFIVLALFSLTLLFLLVWGAMASVKEQFFDFRINVLGFPKELYFENYLTVWKHIEEVVEYSYVELIFNTLIICVIASVGGTFFPCLIGYLVAKYPCKFSGSVYDRTLQIGGTSQKGQYDIYRDISVGDSVFFTDMEGNRFSYSVTNIRYEKNADQSTLLREDASLTLFIKNVYAFEYIIIYCDALG